LGDTVHDALRELAGNLIREAVWVDIADAAELPFDPTNTTGSSIQTNVVELYRNFNRICALVGTKDAISVVAGFGDSVPDALRELADTLVKNGVWVEVIDRTEWQLEETDEEDPW
jgi:hypothetical protein